MKLFSGEEKISINLTLEQYTDYFNNTDIVSFEAFDNFIAIIKDKINSAIGIINSPYVDKAVRDLFVNKHEFLNKAKNLNYSITSVNMTSKPMNFQGYYLPYTEDLLLAANNINSIIDDTLNKFKIILAVVANTKYTDSTETISGVSEFIKIKKEVDKNRELIAKYFPKNDGSTKTTFRDILKSYNEINKIVDNIVRLDNIVNYKRGKDINKEVYACQNLLDTVIENNDKNNVYNTKYKKDLVFVITVTANLIELYWYIYGHCINFYGTFKNNIDDFLKM